jgi:hypothetical protein
VKNNARSTKIIVSADGRGLVRQRHFVIFDVIRVNDAATA